MHKKWVKYHSDKMLNKLCHKQYSLPTLNSTQQQMDNLASFPGSFHHTGGEPGNESMDSRYMYATLLTQT